MFFHVAGAPRKVFSNRIVEPNLAVFYQHHHGRRGKLLPHRSRLKDRFRLHRNVKLDVCQSVAASLDYLSISHDRKRKAGHFLRTHLRRDIRINFFRNFRVVRSRSLRSRDDRRHSPQRDCNGEK